MSTFFFSPSSLVIPTPLRSSPFFTPSVLLNRRPNFSVTRTRVSASSFHVSWFSSPVLDDYRGWAVVESPVTDKKKGLPRVVLVGVGTFVAVGLAAIAHLSLSRNGFRFQLNNSVQALHEILRSYKIGSGHEKDVDTGAATLNVAVGEGNLQDELSAATGNLESAYVKKRERVMTPVAVDSDQEEAISVLKKLKIIEPNIKAHELCTRREYARWLVKANCSLERNPKFRIVPSMLLSGSVATSFDDISNEDPDFEYIQVLAEAGVLPSKLSNKKSSYNLDSSEGQGVFFFPDRYICRQDMINWKVQLDYDLMPETEKISLTKVGFMDMRELSQDASPAFFMDLLTGDKSIFRKVFGKIRRLQPNKPCTKAQAAVTLTSGRMTEEIRAELLRLEAESSSRLVEMEEIKSELLGRGDIQSFWDQKLKEVIAYGFDVEKAYLSIVDELELEKIVEEKCLAEHIKEKAAMDCQRQLLSGLKEEVSEMNSTLEHKRVSYIAEKHSAQQMLQDMQNKQEGLLDAKSILEAEKEALRILRAWVEDEARKSKARAKVLEEVGRRWTWDDGE